MLLAAVIATMVNEGGWYLLLVSLLFLLYGFYMILHLILAYGVVEAGLLKYVIDETTKEDPSGKDEIFLGRNKHIWAYAEAIASGIIFMTLASLGGNQDVAYVGMCWMIIQGITASSIKKIRQRYAQESQ